MNLETHKRNYLLFYWITLYLYFKFFSIFLFTIQMTNIASPMIVSREEMRRRITNSCCEIRYDGDSVGIPFVLLTIKPNDQPTSAPPFCFVFNKRIQQKILIKRVKMLRTINTDTTKQRQRTKTVELTKWLKTKTEVLIKEVHVNEVLVKTCL